MSNHEIITTAEAPAPIGPYSQAVRAGSFLFLTGQIPLTPAGELVGGDVAIQTRQVINNMSAVLREAGAGLENIVKTTVFLRDLEDFSAMNDEYARAFGASKPARSTVEVARLPKDAAVEIEAVAFLPDAR